MNYEPRAEFLYYEPGAEKLKVSIRQELLSELRELRRKHAFQMSSLWAPTRRRRKRKSEKKKKRHPRRTEQEFPFFAGLGRKIVRARAIQNRRGVG